MADIDQFTKGQVPAIPERFKPVTGVEDPFLGPDQQQFEQTSGGTLFEGGLKGTAEEFEQAIPELQKLRDTLHRVENPDLYEPEAQGHDRNRFKTSLFKQFGGNPFMRNIADEAKARFNAEIKALWEHFFGGTIPWGGRLTQVQAKEWAAVQEAFQADLYNEIKMERDDQIEAFKYAMGEFDAQIAGERADERLALAQEAEERLQAKEAKDTPEARAARIASDEAIRQSVREPFIEAREKRKEKRKISGEERAQKGQAEDEERKAELKRREDTAKFYNKMFTQPNAMWAEAQKVAKADTDALKKARDLDMITEEGTAEVMKEVKRIETSKLGPFVEFVYPGKERYNGKPRFTKYMVLDPQWGWVWRVEDHKDGVTFNVAAQDIGWFNEGQQMNLGKPPTR